MSYNRHSEEVNSLLYCLIKQYWPTMNLFFPKARFFCHVRSELIFSADLKPEILRSPLFQCKRLAKYRGFKIMPAAPPRLSAEAAPDSRLRLQRKEVSQIRSAGIDTAPDHMPWWFQ